MQDERTCRGRPVGPYWMKPQDVDKLSLLSATEKASHKNNLSVFWQEYDSSSGSVDALNGIYYTGMRLNELCRIRQLAANGSSFTAKRINATTFVIREDDAYKEHPLIYAKLYSHPPVLVLSDTGCDEPSEEHKHDKVIHLREFLEHCAVADNDNKPLNPGGKLKYIIICTHCHYDHTLGIPQFLAGGTTEIIASAAGRDFIESDLNSHGIFKYIGRPAPYYQVTKWAQAFERLQYPFPHSWDDVSRIGAALPHMGGTPASCRVRAGQPLPISSSTPASAGTPRDPRFRQFAMQAASTPLTKQPSEQSEPHRIQSLAPLGDQDVLKHFDFDKFLSTPLASAKIDLGITIIQTPGHTPDELAWYDHTELHLYVGDSFYREGPDGMRIIFPGEGNLIEWVFSMQKLAVFVRGENARAAAALEQSRDSDDDEDGWVQVELDVSERKAPRVKVSCAHQTVDVDGAEIIAELEAFSFRVFVGKVPVVASKKWHDGEIYDTWSEKGEDRTPMSIFAPRRLMEDARKFFGHDVAGKDSL